MVALRCDAIEVEDSVLLTGGFTANAKVDFEGARITSSFNCSGGHFQCADETPGQEPSATIALNGAAMRVGVDIKLGRYAAAKFAHHPIDFTASGRVVLSGTRVGGSLDCRHAHFNAIKADNGTAYAFYSDGLCTRGDADFRKSKTSGTIRLRGAHIGGSLRCSGAIITSQQNGEPKTFALDCIGITINACAFLNDGFIGIGGINFRSATIRESVDCSGGTFDNPGNPQYASEGFTALRLSYANIGAGLYMTGIARFDGCLNLEHAEAQTVQDDGSAWLPESKMQPGRPMTDTEALGAPLQRATAQQWKQELTATKKYFKNKKRLDCKTVWQEIPLGRCFIKLDGFRYQRYVHPLLGDDHCSNILIAWLRCQPTECKWEDFRPQPWHQLSSVMKSMGHKVFSNRIAVKYNALAAKRPYGTGLRRVPAKIGHAISTLFSWIGGYGYMPFRTLWFIIPLLIIGWITFAFAGNYGFMAPRQDAMIAYLAKENTARALTAANGVPARKLPAASLPDYYPHFNALIYTIDIFIPVFDLGQESTWEPVLEQHGVPHSESPWWRISVGQSTEWTTGNAFCSKRLCNDPLTTQMLQGFQIGLHRVLYWIEVVAGWVLGTLLISGVSGWMKKD